MKIIIITGGIRGIGASAARLCAKAGMGIILTYNSNPGSADAIVAGIEEEGWARRRAQARSSRCRVVPAIPRRCHHGARNHMGSDGL